MQLGNFSLSLSVKNIQTSLEFYQKLGFTVFHGDITQKWLILKNGNCILGLFEGMFEKNIMTFNPGWDENAQSIAPFTDVREIQKQLEAQQIALQTRADENTTGPASCTLTDPDGNQILLDQHV